MVFLIGKKDERLAEIKNALDEDQISCKPVSWNEDKEAKDALYVILSLPDNKEHLNALLRSNKGLFYISICEDETLEKYDNILKLPPDISPRRLKSIVKWVLSLEERTLCIDLLKSFFTGTDLQIFFIDDRGIILYSVPGDDTFLGYTTEQMVAESFEELFGLSINTIPEFGRKKDRIRYFLDANGREISVNTVRVPSNKVEIPGTPDGTEAILILTEINVVKTLKEKSDRLAAVQSHLVKQRAAELEAANEVLQNQALDLRDVLEQLEARNQQMIEELTLASELQKSLLPKEFPKDIPLNFAHKYLPYAYIGGDFFEFIRIDTKRIGMVITDVSGHGVAAAFITAMFKSAFNLFAQNESSPANTLSKLNKEFAETIHTEQYLTAFYSIIDTETLKCTYCNAGHPKQLLFRANGDVEELTTVGFFVGMFEGTEYEEKEIQLFPGDRLLYYTDGVLEASNAEGVQFGRENLRRVVKENSNSDLDTLSGIIISELIMYMEGDSFDDDITILLAEVMENI